MRCYACDKMVWCPIFTSLPDTLVSTMEHDIDFTDAFAAKIGKIVV